MSTWYNGYNYQVEEKQQFFETCFIFQIFWLFAVFIAITQAGVVPSYGAVGHGYGFGLGHGAVVAAAPAHDPLEGIDYYVSVP